MLSRASFRSSLSTTSQPMNMRLPFTCVRFDRLRVAHALSLDMLMIINNEADFTDVPGLKIEN